MKNFSSKMNPTNTLLLLGSVLALAAVIIFIDGQTKDAQITNSELPQGVSTYYFDTKQWPRPNGELVYVEDGAFPSCQGALYFTSLPAKCIGPDGELMTVNPPLIITLEP